MWVILGLGLASAFCPSSPRLRAALLGARLASSSAPEVFNPSARQALGSRLALPGICGGRRQAAGSLVNCRMQLSGSLMQVRSCRCTFSVS